MLVLSAFFGAAHALTPGHGKTLVAAYLVGERGTTAHALVLGLVTTLTHTGVVLVLALVLRLCFPQGMADDVRRNLHQSLELLGGLLIAGLGCWLLLRRLAGQADHVHLRGAGHHHHHGGHHHHHHHHDHPHSHGAHDHHHEPGRVGWWGLVTLGVSGGIVPCWDAVALLLAAVAMNLFWWALPMLLAFSAGLAGVLILIGLMVVHTRALVGSRLENGRLMQALPLLSALVVTGLGLWLCYSSLHAGTPPQ
jgi:nickel/cobalt exporter